MDEYAALAQRVVLTMDDVRGCLVLSRDGLVLGAFPEDQEAELKPAWLRFVNVGEARKGFVEFCDQLWAFVHRGPYAAFVVTGTSVRPGVMLDQLEQAVIAAEETRAKQKGVTLKVPDAASAPSGRPGPPCTRRPTARRRRPWGARRPPRPRRCRASPRRPSQPRRPAPSPPGRAPTPRSCSRCRRCRSRWPRCRRSCSSRRSSRRPPPAVTPAPAAPSPRGPEPPVAGRRRSS